MGQDGRDGRLRIGPRPGFDPGDLAQLGIAPVGRRRTRLALKPSPPSARVRTAARPRRHRSRSRMAGDEGQVRRMPARRLGEQFSTRVGVLDVPAEGIEADLAGPERGRRRAEQAARIVDDAHGLERRRVPATSSGQAPSASRKRTEPLRSATVRPSRRVSRPPTSAVSEPVAREGERGAQAHRSGTDDGNVIGPSRLTGCLFTISVWTVRRLTINACIRHCRPAHRLPMIDP